MASPKKRKLDEIDAGKVTGTQPGPSRIGSESGGGASAGASVQVPFTPGAHSQRETVFQRQEHDGALSFQYACNDGDPYHSIWIICLKNIFSKQLPNMPRSYIARLLMDRSHRSVVVVRRGTQVVGGITYRPFHSQGFGEIAFCAVTAPEQVKGFGARLMNWTKEYARMHDSLQYFLTYADNNAVGYFSKQGFTTGITMPKDQWHGWIKDYDGGTLMEGRIHSTLAFVRFPQMLRCQRQALDAAIRSLSRCHIVYPGLSHSGPDGQCIHIPIDQIPGVKEAGWSAEQQPVPRLRLLLDRTVSEPTPSNLQRFMSLVLAALQAQEESWPFREPVPADEVPDYYTIIKNPVDLSLVEKRLSSARYYLTLDIFLADLRRMISNCHIYNGADTVYYKQGSKLESFLDQYLMSHVLMDQTG
ncbi:hypothetical protein WJX84_008428 [Apatococcus fuscideae]|uniref:histone acetyltransferase n=1 Tax=Apatococcus fuscideae TaxID=2026836 RepID=A0AAW1SVD5_9CHLO